MSDLAALARIAVSHAAACDRSGDRHDRDSILRDARKIVASCPDAIAIIEAAADDFRWNDDAAAHDRRWE